MAVQLLVHVCLVSASPLQIKREVNCLDPGAPYDESCWETLNLTNWITDWKTNAPTCTSADDGTHCCNPDTAPNEPWTACFLRLALANADYDCTVFNGDSCGLVGFELSPDILTLGNVTLSAQYRYIVRNIYGMSAFLIRTV